ncbi:MAG: ThiF family adenylyltransferase [Deltaproteobacteria bacterium]|nr:ThiF family adenylyltransferase [Deltaproteobacteria bacterium]
MKIAIFGCGGLGVPAAWTLAAAGASELLLVDPDHVERSNLHRQVLYREADLGRPKAQALAEALQRRFPTLRVQTLQAQMDADSVRSALRGYDAGFEGTDDAAMKFHVSDAVIAARTDTAGRDAGARLACIAAAIGRRGQHFVVGPQTACYRCLFEAPPPPESVASCRIAGVIGPVVGEVGARAARALWRALHGRAEPARSALVRLDAGRYDRIAVDVAQDCSCRGGPGE